MRLEDEEVNRIADRLAEKLCGRMPARVDTEGKIHGLDPHRLYTAQQVAERWNVSTDTVYRNLERADWNGQGARFRGVDILQYEGVDVEPDPPSSSPGGPSIQTDESTSPDDGGDGRPYKGTLPEL